MKVVEPAVEVQPQELVSCSHGLRALVDAVEARVLADLQTGIAAVFVQACASCVPLSRRCAELRWRLQFRCRQVAITLQAGTRSQCCAHVLACSTRRLPCLLW